MKASLLNTFLLLTVLSPLVSSDCVFPNTVEQVRACYQGFPFNPARAEETIVTVLKGFDLHAYKDSAAFQRVVAEIRSLANQNFRNEWAFQQQLENTVKKLQDANTVYESQCFRQFVFTQPFFLAVEHNPRTKQPEVKVLGVHSYQHSRTNNLYTLYDYVGKVVHKIDDKPALQVIQEWADANEPYRDGNTRLQTAQSSTYWNSEKQRFELVRGNFMTRTALPSNQKMKYEFHGDDGRITIDALDWLVFTKARLPWDWEFREIWKDSDSYWKQNCVNYPILPPNYTAPPNPFPRVFPRSPSQAPVWNPAATNYTTAPLSFASFKDKMPTPLQVGPGFAMFTAQSKKGKTVGIIKISEFSEITPDWKDAMEDGLRQLEEEECQHILIDVSNNGGGAACTAYALLRMLGQGVKQYLSEMPLTPLLEKTIIGATDKRNNTFCTNRWSEDGARPLRDTTLAKQSRTLNGLGYTRLFTEYCHSVDWEKLFPYSHENVAILSNGVCLSTCSLFVQQVENNMPKIQRVVLSASKGHPSFSTSAGSMNFDWDGVVANATDAGLQSPGQFPLKTVFRWPLRRILNEGRQIEYESSTATKKILRTSSMNPDKWWNDAINAVF